MQIFEVIIGLLLTGAILSAWARRIGTPYPALVALAGAVLAVMPGTPQLMLDPELALALFVAPVLLDAAFDASPRDLRANWRAVTSLAVGAVGMTIAAVAWVAHTMVPGMSWGAAVALGSIVAPPDAAAATAVLKQLRPPHRLLVILEGESLFNDASALLVYRLAVGATVSGLVLSWPVVATLFGVTIGSVALGYVVSRIFMRFTVRIQDVPTAVIIQFCSTFGIWLLAERLHLSGILTTVVYAMVAARHAADVVPARIRIPSYAVWEVAVFVLNVLAFILIGLQLKPILVRMDPETLFDYLRVALAVCATAIVARLIWVSAAAAVSSWLCRASAAARTHAVGLSPAGAALVGWCGMRGIVTLAAALALPYDGGDAPFPHRDLILFTAFAVVLGTLVLQGLTLRPLMLWLKLKDDGLVAHEVRLGRAAMLDAGLTATASSPSTETVDLVRRRYDLQLRRAQAELNSGARRAVGVDASASTPRDEGVLRAAIAAERRQLLKMRAEETIGDAAFQQLEQELDWREMNLQSLIGNGPAPETDSEALSN